MSPGKAHVVNYLGFTYLHEYILRDCAVEVKDIEAESMFPFPHQRSPETHIFYIDNGLDRTIDDVESHIPVP